MLAEQGISRFSAEAVAKRAGCSRATLYRLTGGKQVLLESLMGEAAELVAARIRRDTEGLEGPDRIVRALMSALAQVRSNPDIERWTRQAVIQDMGLGSSDAFAWLAAELTGVTDDVGPAGDWLRRVYLMLILWPAGDAATEEQMIRTFVAPAFDRPRD